MQDANHTLAHVHVCAPAQAKGCWAARYNTGLLIELTPKALLFYKQKAACTMAGVAQGSAELHVRLYLALFLTQFLEHLWLLLQVSQQQRQCRGTGVMSSKQQIEGNILHTEQDLMSVLPCVYISE